MAARPQITLRYFDARGRAQFLRAYWRARDVPFEDERVPLSADFGAWLAVRDDRAKTGPFHKLPVLHWGARMLAETLVIAAFVHRESGDEQLLSDEENIRHALLVSSLYGDLMMQIGILIWADLAMPGVDLHALAPRTLDRVRTHLDSLERTLTEWQWLASARSRPIMLADCLLWDQLNLVQRVFGRGAGLDARTTLAEFYGECPGRPAFEALLAERPCQISGRPGEAQAIALLHGILGAGAQ